MLYAKMLSPAPKLLWLTFLLIVPALTLAGVYPSTLPLVLIFLAALTTACIFDALQLSRTLARVQVAAQSPVNAYKDRPALLKLTIETPCQASLALDLPPSFLQQDPVAPHTAPSFPFTPQSRGEFTIQKAFIAAPSTWKLWQMRTEKPIALQVKVFPDLTRDPAARRLFSTLQQGQRVQRVIGRGRELERLRDYAPGDSFDEVYWKGTARRGAPVSKVFQVERTQDIYAILDGSRLGLRNQALERFVTASLLLAVAAEKNNDNFGLLTFNSQVQHFVRASHGKGHFHRCREAVFALQPSPESPDFAELFTFINLRIRKRALLFFLTDLSDPLLAETFSRDAAILTRRHVVMLNQIADAADRPLFSGPPPETGHDIEARLAGHLQWAKLRELEKALRHIGVHMHLLRPEQTSAELIAQYLRVKQRQLL